MSARMSETGGTSGWHKVANGLTRNAQALGLRAYDIAVYVALSSHDSGKGWSIAIETLAAEAGCSRSSVKRSLSKLTDLGLIAAVGRYHDGGQAANRYRVNRSASVLTGPISVERLVPTEPISAAPSVPTGPTMGSHRTDDGSPQDHVRKTPKEDTRGDTAPTAPYPPYPHQREDVHLWDESVPQRLANRQARGVVEDGCAVCGHPLWSWQSKELGVCGKTDRAHDAAREDARRALGLVS